jgi:hypothetical protein
VIRDDRDAIRSARALGIGIIFIANALRTFSGT